MVKFFQHLIDALWRGSCKVGKVCLFDIDKISEHSWVGAQDSLYDEVCLFVRFVDAVQFFLAEDEMEG